MAPPMLGSVSGNLPPFIPAGMPLLDKIKSHTDTCSNRIMKYEIYRHASTWRFEPHQGIASWGHSAVIYFLSNTPQESLSQQKQHTSVSKKSEITFGVF